MVSFSMDSTIRYWSLNDLHEIENMRISDIK